jgi:hypothetical protein
VIGGRSRRRPGRVRLHRTSMSRAWSSTVCVPLGAWRTTR